MINKTKMNIWGFMQSMGMIAGLREKLLRAGVSAKDLEGVKLDDPASFTKLAEKIGPTLLRNNPELARQIKESNMLEGQTKEDVVEVIDSI